MCSSFLLLLGVTEGVVHVVSLFIQLYFLPVKKSGKGNKKLSVYTGLLSVLPLPAGKSSPVFSSSHFCELCFEFGEQSKPWTQNKNWTFTLIGVHMTMVN